MILRCSAYAHVVPVGGGRVLFLHAVTQMRLTTGVAILVDGGTHL